MYDRFYNLTAEPFRLSADHFFAYPHRGFSKARAYMAYAYLRAEGFVMVTGRPGTGKTTLIGAMVEQLADENVSTANLVCTQLQADDLLKLVAYEFGVDPGITQKGELLQQLTRRLKAWHRDGRRALLIVDEAQALSVSAMEELRLLTNIQVEGRPLLQIFLLGQPELRELILSPQMEQVHQRIVAASHLEPLRSDETEAYIRHRLEAVGWKDDPKISKAVYPLVFKFSEGIPRRINLICSRLFLHCAVEQRHEVCTSDVQEAVRELQSENLAAGPRFTKHDFQVPDSFDEPPPAQVGAARGPVAFTRDENPGADGRARRADDEEEPRSQAALGSAGGVTTHKSVATLRQERGQVVRLSSAENMRVQSAAAPARARSGDAAPGTGGARDRAAGRGEHGAKVPDDEPEPARLSSSSGRPQQAPPRSGAVARGNDTTIRSVASRERTVTTDEPRRQKSPLAAFIAVGVVSALLAGAAVIVVTHPQFNAQRAWFVDLFAR